MSKKQLKKPTPAKEMTPERVALDRVFEPVKPNAHSLATKAAELAEDAWKRFKRSEELAVKGEGHLPDRLIKYQECRELSRLSQAFASAAMALIATGGQEV